VGIEDIYLVILMTIIWIFIYTVPSRVFIKTNKSLQFKIKYYKLLKAQMCGYNHLNLCTNLYYWNTTAFFPWWSLAW